MLWAIEGWLISAEQMKSGKANLVFISDALREQIGKANDRDGARWQEN